MNNHSRITETPKPEVTSRDSSNGREQKKSCEEIAEELITT